MFTHPKNLFEGGSREKGFTHQFETLFACNSNWNWTMLVHLVSFAGEGGILALEHLRRGPSNHDHEAVVVRGVVGISQVEAELVEDHITTLALQKCHRSSRLSTPIIIWDVLTLSDP